MDSRAVLLFRADALEAAQRLLSEEAEEVARRRAEVLRIADEESAAAGGVADAAQRYDQRRRDLSDAAEQHADEEMRSRKAQKKEYDDAKREKRSARKLSPSDARSGKMMSGSCGGKARPCSGGRRAMLDWCRGRRVGASRTKMPEELGRQEHQAAQKAAGAAAQKEYKDTQQRAYQRAVAEHAQLVQHEDYERAVAEHARRPPQVAGPPSVRDLVRQFVGDRGSADALCARRWRLKVLIRSADDHAARRFRRAGHQRVVGAAVPGRGAEPAAARAAAAAAPAEDGAPGA